MAQGHKRFARAQVATSRDVGCFLRLYLSAIICNVPMLVDPGYGLTIDRATDSGYTKMYTFRLYGRLRRVSLSPHAQE